LALPVQYIQMILFGLIISLPKPLSTVEQECNGHKYISLYTHVRFSMMMMIIIIS